MKVTIDIEQKYIKYSLYVESGGLWGLFFPHKGEKCEAFSDHHEIVETQNDM